MLELRIFWDAHKGSWPQHGDARRWSDKELDELKVQLNFLGLAQVSNAIGSLEFDKIDQKHSGGV